MGEHKLKREGKPAAPRTDRRAVDRASWKPREYKGPDGTEYEVHSNGVTYQRIYRKLPGHRPVMIGLRRVGFARNKERDVLTGQYKNAVVPQRSNGQDEEGQERQEQAAVDPHREQSEIQGGE